MVDEFVFLCAWMVPIAGMITPLWCGCFYLIRFWGDRRYPLDEDGVPETRDAFYGDDRSRSHEQPQRSVKG
jgi:hypothetical protein